MEKGIIKAPCSRGGSGALYLQSAIVGVMDGKRVCVDAAALYKRR